MPSNCARTINGSTRAGMLGEGGSGNCMGTVGRGTPPAAPCRDRQHKALRRRRSSLIQWAQGLRGSATRRNGRTDRVAIPYGHHASSAVAGQLLNVRFQRSLEPDHGVHHRCESGRALVAVSESANFD